MSELKPVAQVAFELRTNILKGQWESGELNDIDFFRAMCREYEDYIPALQQRITKLEYQLGNYKAAADGTTHWCAECKMRDDRITKIESENVNSKNHKLQIEEMMKMQMNEEKALCAGCYIMRVPCGWIYKDTYNYGDGSGVSAIAMVFVPEPIEAVVWG